MGFNNLAELGAGNTLDLEILNDLAENDRYLKSIIPDVYIRAANGKIANSEQGSQMKVQGGHIAVPQFTGTTTVSGRFVSAHNASYAPVVVLTAKSQVPVWVTVVKSDSRGFTAKIVSTTKTRMRGVYINWVALTQS